MIKAVLFDYDGTLSYRQKAAYDMYRYCVGQMRKDLDPDGMELEAIVQYCMLIDENGIPPKDTVWKQLKEKYIPDLDVDYWTEYWKQNFDRFQVPSEGAEQILKELRKHYKTGILSNGSYASQKAKIQNLKMDELVDELIITGQYGIAKPDPRIFEIAADKLGVKCEETVFVGDTFFTDIIGAYNAGMKPVWYAPHEDIITEVNVPIIRHFNELPALLEGGMK